MVGAGRYGSGEMVKGFCDWFDLSVLKKNMECTLGTGSLNVIGSSPSKPALDCQNFNC